MPLVRSRARGGCHAGAAFTVFSLLQLALTHAGLAGLTGFVAPTGIFLFYSTYTPCVCQVICARSPYKPAKPVKPVFNHLKTRLWRALDQKVARITLLRLRRSQGQNVFAVPDRRIRLILQPLADGFGRGRALRGR